MSPTDPTQPRQWPPRPPRDGAMHLHIHQRNVEQWIIDALDAEADRLQRSRGALIVDILTQWATDHTADGALLHARLTGLDPAQLDAVYAELVAAVDRLGGTIGGGIAPRAG